MFTLMKRGLLALLVSSVLTTSVSAQRLVGANYTHWRVGPNCDLTDGGILATYDLRGIRSTVRDQLANMHSAGVDSIRFMIWYGREPAQSWGQVQLQGQQRQLSRAHVKNLRLFLQDAVASGIQQVSISLAPKGNIGPQFSNYDRTLWEDNWRVLVQARDALIASGVPSFTFDLLNEGAPNNVHRPGGVKTSANSWYDANITQYIQAMYSRYADNYGTMNVTVSSILEDPQALVDLIAIFRSTQRALPSTFEVHGYFWWYTDLSRGIFDGLTQADTTLSTNLLSQALALGETYYNNAAVSLGIGNYLATTTRALTQVTEWPATATSTCGFNVPPPYRVDSYMPLGY